MIRKIPIEQLLPGMCVVDLHKPWMEHDFWRSQFVVRDQATIDKMVVQGISEVSIDLQRGIDIPERLALPTHVSTIPTFRERTALKPATLSLGEERRRAARLLTEAQATVQELIMIAQIGGSIEAGRLEPVVQRMVESVSRNRDALVPLTRLKGVDRYSAEHAVATSSLIIALGRQLELDEPEVERLALGAMLKDIGELSLSGKLTEKPGSLSRGERSIVERHVEESLSVLEATSRLDETTIAVILEHHERFDGSGYPYRREGDDISLAGRMAAIVDTYDAMTSDRPYRHALSPSSALTHIFEQGGQDFDAGLVASFVHTVGVYPVGTLVRLESGHLGVVEAQNADAPLQPTVRIIYHARRKEYVVPTEVDLSRKFGNHYGKIVSAEEFARWGLSAQRWQPA